MLKTIAIPGTLAAVTDLVVSREKTLGKPPGPVRRSNYWRDRSARDEKSQSIVVARLRNEDASDEGPSHSSASISTLFEDCGISVRRSSLFPHFLYLTTDV